MSHNHEEVQSIRRFRAYTGSEHTPVLSIRRFKEYASSKHTPVQSIHRFKVYTGSSIHKFRVYADTETNPLRACIGSSQILYQTLKLYTLKNFISWKTVYSEKLYTLKNFIPQNFWTPKFLYPENFKTSNFQGATKRPQSDNKVPNIFLCTHIFCACVYFFVRVYFLRAYQSS